MPERGPLVRRLPCPVCLGVALEKVSIARVERRNAGALVLDHCTRCGGVWFEEGEIPVLARHSRATLLSRVGARETSPMPPCHGCDTPLARGAARCQACGRSNVLSCPACQSPMRRAERRGLVLDACERCHGVWFDHAELEHVWTLSVEESEARWREEHRQDLARNAGRRKASRGAVTAGDVGGAMIEGLAYTPDLFFHGASAVGHAAAGAGEAIVSGAAAEAATAAVEIAGDAAAGVFEVIAEIIGSIFDGL